MRKVLVLFLAMTLIIAAASPALARYVANSKTTSVVVEGYWSTGEWGEDTISFGYAGAYQTVGAREGSINYNESVGVRVLCDNGTPEDLDDDWWGYFWTDTMGWGPATISVSKAYSSGQAEGTVDTWSYSYSDCDNMYFEPENGNGSSVSKEVSLALIGTSPVIRESSGYSFHIPGQYNDRAKYQSTYREAQGVVTVDGEETAVYGGRIGKFTETFHINSK